MDRRLNTLCWSFCSLYENGTAKETILSCAPIEISANDPVGFGADKLMKYLNATLSYYGKTNEDIKAIIGNNYSTNQLLATKLGVPLIGCRRHIFNLAVNKYLDRYDEIIHVAMGKLCHLKNFSELKKLTDLNPIKQNVTHWSSTYEMCERYFRIENEIKCMPVMVEFLPSATQTL
jgi:hypothetical protein